jgi:hypothetical protein
MAEEIEVRGLAELQTTLLNMPINASRIAMREALIAGGTVFLDEIEATIPRLTGELAGDMVIVAKVGSDLSKNFCEVGPAYIPGRTKDSEDDPGVFIKFLEFGHRSPSGKNGKSKGTMIPPHPLMRPAFAAGADRALQAFVEVIRALLGPCVTGTGTSSAALPDGGISANMGGRSASARDAKAGRSATRKSLSAKQAWSDYVKQHTPGGETWQSFRSKRGV